MPGMNDTPTLIDKHDGHYSMDRPLMSYTGECLRTQRTGEAVARGTDTDPLLLWHLCRHPHDHLQDHLCDHCGHTWPPALLVIEFDHRSDGGPKLVGPFFGPGHAKQHLAQLEGPDWEASYNFVPLTAPQADQG